MKRLGIVFVVLAFICGIAFLAWKNSDLAKPVSEKGYAMISSPQLVAMLTEKVDMQIIDLREQSLYKKGHIPGAINIPFDEFHSRMSEVAPNKPVVFVCHDGPMGDVTSKMLVESGRSNVSNLKGGMSAWDGPVAK